jgi:uncharacterized protein
MKIAIIGTGISGLVAAWLLNREHEITVYEASGYAGGHTNTVPVRLAGRDWAVDTGSIVYTRRTYPNFVRLIEQLGVESKPTSMSFSVKCERTGLEYAGRSPSSLFAQRSNLLSPRFYRMLRDIMRFNREAKTLLTADVDMTLGEYVKRAGYSEVFLNHYLIPMGAAVWSANPNAMREFPARYFVEFFENHGMLSLRTDPQWRVIKGGSCRYVNKLTASFRDRIRLNAPVYSISRFPQFVKVTTRTGETDHFDRVVIAAHSDQALRMLADASSVERTILSAFRYQRNEAVLHTDSTILPASRRAWASCNYCVPLQPRQHVAVTYNMNILQGMEAPEQFCVTLNQSEAIDPSKVIRRIVYHHPVYNTEAVRAQSLHHRINGINRVHFCGAYWGYGFHEDGVNSAIAACRPLLSVDERDGAGDASAYRRDPPAAMAAGL